LRVKQPNDEDSSFQPSDKHLSADPASEVKIRARRRLIGAAILALTAAVVVPMVLDTKPTPWADDIPIQIPAKDSKFEPKLTVPVGSKANVPTAKSSEQLPEKPIDKAADKAAEKTLPGAVPEAVAVVNTPPPAVVKPVTPSEGSTVKAEPPAASTETPKQKTSHPQTASVNSKSVEKSTDKANETVKNILADKPKPANANKGKVIVQAGAFVSEEKIKTVEQQLRKAGFTSYREEIHTEKGVVTRLRFAMPSEQAANQAVAKLALEGLSPKIVSQ